MSRYRTFEPRPFVSILIIYQAPQTTTEGFTATLVTERPAPTTVTVSMAINGTLQRALHCGAKALIFKPFLDNGVDLFRFLRQSPVSGWYFPSGQVRQENVHALRHLWFKYRIVGRLHEEGRDRKGFLVQQTVKVRCWDSLSSLFHQLTQDHPPSSPFSSDTNSLDVCQPFPGQFTKIYMRQFILQVLWIPCLAYSLT
jgi:hypothetical protein